MAYTAARKIPQKLQRKIVCLFGGSFVHPGTGRTNFFHGAVLQTSSDPSDIFSVSIGGWFLGTNQGGNIRAYLQ